MTGLLVNPNQELLQDTLQERYTKLRDSIQKLTTLQIGICLWKVDEKDQNKLIATPYTFHLFPVRRDFVVSSGAFQFLASHNFDFNKVFKEGIPFLNENQAEAFQHEYKNSRELRLDSKDIEYLNEKVFVKECLIFQGLRQLLVQIGK
jgi:poly(A)-specific ribonuclease